MRYSWRGWPMTLPLHHFYEIITIDGSKANTNSFRHRKPSPLQHTKQNSNKSNTNGSWVREIPVVVT